MKKIVFFILFIISSHLHAVEINNIRSWSSPDSVRYVWDVDSQVNYNAFILQNPLRLVVDIEKSFINKNPSIATYDWFNSIRISQDQNRIRFVFDLKFHINYQIFNLTEGNNRIVLDIQKDTPETKANIDNNNIAKSSTSSQLRDIVIVIDPGHGGRDPGAVGPNGTREKDIVLQISKELADIINKKDGFKAVLTRNTDVFIELRDRTLIARRSKADFFISIHADGWKTPTARGASVWVLSERGASSEMGRWLARRENSAHLLGGDSGLDLSDKDNVLANVLLDMSMTASRNNAQEIANDIHRNISVFARMHKPHVENAAFAVLRSPDIPSILVETGFITNPNEEKQLKTKEYQRRIANAIAQGAFDYFTRNPPENTFVRNNINNQTNIVDRHRVRAGETLSQIANRYNISVSSIKRINNLNNDNIKVNQELFLK